MRVPIHTDLILHVIDLLGVAVFAVSGALTAGRRRLDLLGVLVIAALTAIGGGTIRDLLVDRHPIFWIAEPIYLVVIACAALGTVIWARTRPVPRSALLWADALGLAFFTIGGAGIAEQAGLPALAVILMGAITGSAGGVLRDVLCAEVPMILRQGELYATAAIAGATVYILLEGAHLPRPLPSVLGMLVIFGLRLAAIVWHLTLPVFTPHGEVDAEEDRDVR